MIEGMLFRVTARTLAVAVAGLSLQVALGQAARIVLNNNAWLRIDNSAWVVVENPANTGIQTLGTGGNIRSEGEFNRIRWQIRNTTGAYVVPFTTANGVKMPFTYQANAGASNEAQASICFSTYNYGGIAGTNWNNDLYRPSDVTHMYNYWTGAPVNNSDNVVDRFWIVDPYAAPAFAYSARPSITLGFTYDPGAATGDVRTGNAITGLSAVGAQRFNAPAGMWGDFWPAGAWAAGPVNAVTGANVPAADFFRSWTLSNILEPLPVELLRFHAECEGDEVRLVWTTGSEQGASHFAIQRSSDGLAFEEIGQVAATGNSGSATEYAFTDTRPLSVGYYRLQMVDADGTRALGPVQVTNCGNGPTRIVNAWDGGDVLQVVIASSRDQTAALHIHDAAGKLVMEQGSLPLMEGANTFTIDQRGMAMGIYVLSIATDEGPLTRRLPVH